MKLIPTVVTGALIVSGWCWIAQVKKNEDPQRIQLEPVVHTSYDPSAIGRTISFHESRVAHDPQGAIGWSLLSEAWLARSRESDLDTAAWQAEAAARKSLALRTRGNGRAFQALVASLLEQHRFQDAKKTLENAGNRTRVYADVLLEMGEFDRAETILRKLDSVRDPSVKATLARLSSERGDHKRAIRLLTDARKALETNASVTEQTLAWFDVKLGNEYFKTAQTAEAENSYLSALKLFPRSYKAMLGMAYVEASIGEWTAARDYANRALQVANSLEAVAILGDSCKASGDLKGAKQHYETCLNMYRKECAIFTKAGKGGPFGVRPIDRQFATFCAKRSLFVNEALTAARRDLKNRPDGTARENLAKLTELSRQSA